VRLYREHGWGLKPRSLLPAEIRRITRSPTFASRCVQMAGHSVRENGGGISSSLASGVITTGVASAQVAAV
jgi:hypothetical protein